MFLWWTCAATQLCAHGNCHRDYRRHRMGPRWTHLQTHHRRCRSQATQGTQISWLEICKKFCTKFSTGLQLSEYVQVVCRKMNETCWKSVFKTPTFRFFRDFRLFQQSAKLSKDQIWVNFSQKEISTQKRRRRFFRLQRLCIDKKLENSDMRFWKKVKNLHFWSF